MAGRELDVKDIEEIKRLKALGFSKRKIALIARVHRDTVTKYLEQIDQQPTDQPATHAPLGMVAPPPSDNPQWFETLDWPRIRDEILRGVPINIVYDEHAEAGKVPVQYPAFWKQLQKRAPCLSSTMVRVFTPGERTEIDYCDGIDLVNVATGELIKTELFVGVLCSSRYTFAEFTMSQKSEDFLSSHVRMFEFFGGCSQVVSPDNLKSAVTKAHRYDPVLNPAYTKLAAHYGIAVVPARVKRPQDKAIVERTIQIFQRWFFMRVRHRSFTSLVELNQCLKEHLVLFNNKRHRTFGRSRAEMFEDERGSLMPLPPEAYHVATYAKAQLSRDCHLRFADNFYSAPHGLRGLDLDVWATATTVEVYHNCERVALHARYTTTTGKYRTDPSHYPPEHQAYLEEDIVKSKAWAMDIGPETAKLIEGLLSGPYPLRHLRRAQGILALSRRYSRPGLEGAAQIANRFDQKTIQYLERVIKQNQTSVSKAASAKGGEPIKRESNPHLRGVEKIYH
jgi:transposase